MMITAGVLSMAVGAIISILADWVPKFSPWYQKLDGIGKRWIMLILLLITSILIVVFTCWEFTQPIISQYVLLECSEAGVSQVIAAFFNVLVGNQSMFLISPTASKRRK